jgi:hypothetical protein
MVEESTPFGSKMLEVEDSIEVSNQNIIYYQNLNGEQIDLAVESSNPTQVYSASDDKKTNHTLIVDKNQSEFDLIKSTKWILEINLKNVLTNYLFSQLKRYRTFEGLLSQSTKENDVNTAIKDYVTFNVLNRYKFEKIDLYIQYENLIAGKLLKYQTIWDETIVMPENELTRYQTDLFYDDSSVKILFNQEKSADLVSFKYYFNIFFVKI